MKLFVLGIAIALTTATICTAPAAPMKGAPWVPVFSAQLTPAQRSAIISKLVSTWAPFVQAVYKTSPDIWAKRMATTFAAANDTNLQRAAGMKTFQGMVSALVGSQVSDAKVIDSLASKAQVLKSGPIPALLGDVTDDLVYTPIAPCRIVDTRAKGGAIAGKTTRSFIGYTSTDFSSQGGISGSDCGIPPNPSALVINVTVVPTQAGYLTVWPFGTTQPLASSLNYGAGDVVGNEIVAGMTLGSATDQFSVFPSGQTQLVVDAVGYFMAPEATAADCTTVIGPTVAVPATGIATEADAPMCPATYTQVSTGCVMGSNVGVLNTIINGTCFGSSSVADTLYAQAVCCRVPGR